MIRLRAATHSDLGYLTKLAQDPQVEPFLAPGAGSPERFETVLAQASADGDPGGLFVIETPSGERAGGLALQVIGRHSRICELTRLMIEPDARGSGVGAQAVALACRHALLDHGFHRVEAETYGDNLAAQRLFERVGFVREGVRRRAYWRRDQWLDGVVYGILAEELRDIVAASG